MRRWDVPKGLLNWPETEISTTCYWIERVVFHTSHVLCSFPCLSTTYKVRGIPCFLCWYNEDAAACLLISFLCFQSLVYCFPLLTGGIKSLQWASLEGSGWIDGSLFPKLLSLLLLFLKWGHFTENVIVFHLVLWLVESQKQIWTFYLRNEVLKILDISCMGKKKSRKCQKLFLLGQVPLSSGSLETVSVVWSRWDSQSQVLLHHCVLCKVALLQGGLVDLFPSGSQVLNNAQNVSEV